MNISEWIGDNEEALKAMTENYISNIRVAIPAIIVRFDSEKQTASVQPTIKDTLQGQAVALPELSDVPVQYPRAGGYSLTFPVQPGDECLLVFSDMCIDGWWQSSGVQNQAEKRRHDLSDACAILGITSVPKALKKVCMEGVQLRNDSGTDYIQISEQGILLKSKNIRIEGKTDIVGITNVTGVTTVNGSHIGTDGTSTIKGKVEITGNAVIGGISFAGHTHGGVETGGGNTQPPK